MNPKEVSVSRPATTAITVKQGLAIVPEMDKREALRRLIKSEDVQNALIFCNRKRDVDILYKSLKRHGFDVGALHGDMSQPARTETLERFKNNEIRLLCASDVAARGLDVDNLSHVFNFDVPIHAEDYVHRIGRTGRAGRSGTAYTLATPDDGRFVAAIEQMIGQPIPRLEIPELGTEFAPEEEGGRRRGRGRGRPATTGRGSRSAPPGEKRGEKREPRRAAKADAPPPPPAERADHDEQPAPQAAAPRREDRRQRQPEPRHSEPRHSEPRHSEARHAEHDRRDERPRRDDRREERHDERRDDRRDDRRSGSRRPSRDHDSGPPVIGMGDHMPAFLARPARER
jgi:superfamily II DNA/RNA helicase